MSVGAGLGAGLGSGLGAGLFLGLGLGLGGIRACVYALDPGTHTRMYTHTHISGLDDIMSLLDFRKKPGEPGAEPKPKLDEYERTVKELNFETRWVFAREHVCVDACVCVCVCKCMCMRMSFLDLTPPRTN